MAKKRFIVFLLIMAMLPLSNMYVNATQIPLRVGSCTDEYSDLGSGNQLSQVKDSRSYSEALSVSVPLCLSLTGYQLIEGVR